MANTKISAYPDGVTPQNTDESVWARAGTNVKLTYLQLLSAIKTAVFGSVSGDASATGAGAVTLATVNASPGTFTNATLTVNGKGLVTAASSGVVSGTVTNFSFTNGGGFTGTVLNAGTTPALSLVLDAASVALTKLATQATLTIVGNNTGGAASPVALTTAQVKAFLTYSATDVGLSNVTNDVQTKAAIVPNTAPGTGQILVGNAGGTAYAPVTVSGDVTVDSAGATTIGALKVTTGMVAANAVTLAKIQNAAANSKLLGSGAAGSGSPYVEISLGTNLSMSGNTLNATGGGTADGGFWYPGLTGRYYSDIQIGTTLTTLAVAADSLILIPFSVANNFAVDRLGFSVTTASAAGKTGKIVIYDSAATGGPNNLVFTSTALATDSIAYVEDTTASFTFTAGTQYWVGVWMEDTPTLRSGAAAQLRALGAAAGGSATVNVKLNRSVSYAGAAPNPWTLVTGDFSITANAPAVFMRMA